MSTRHRLRLCHGGMEGRALATFEMFLKHVENFDCELVEEAGADIAVIDTDNYLGPYLVQAHRMLFPKRPMIHVSLKGELARDALSVWIEKPVSLEKFAHGLAQALAAGRAPQHDAKASGSGTDKEAAGRRASAIVQDQADTRLSNLYVGSLPDLDPADAGMMERAYYQPGKYLQGIVEEACRIAESTDAAANIVHGEERIMTIRADGQAYETSLDRRSLRSLGLIPLSKADFRVVTVNTGADANRAWRAIAPLRWELALWAARGRIPTGVPIRAPIRLVRWPNLTRLGLPPDAMRIAGLWASQARSMPETATLLGIPQRHVFAFFSACRSIAAVHCEAVPVAPPTPATAAPEAAPAPKRRGLFNRILGKLLGNQRADTAQDHP